VHLSSGLGIALLGLASAPAELDPLPGALEVGTWRAAVQSAAVTAETDVVTFEGRHVIYTELWNEFLGTAGEWEEVEIDADTIALRPMSEDCAVGIYSIWRDEIHDYPMAPGTELLFRAGLIAVNQRGRSEWMHASASPSTAAMSSCDMEFDMSTVADFTFGGDCWEEFPPGEGCHLDISCSGSDAGGCTLELTLTCGIGPSRPISGSCGGSSPLSAQICDNDETASMVMCVDLP
jgi:hypothetical protein